MRYERKSKLINPSLRKLTQFEREHLKNPFVTAWDLDQGHISEVTIKEGDLENGL